MSRQEEEIKGIILRQIEYKDNDAIINVLSRQGELYGFYARGIKKVTSKNANAVQVFAYSDIDYFVSQKGLHTLKRAKIIKNYFESFKDYNKIIVAFMLLDVVYDVASLHLGKNPDLFKLLSKSLEEINEVNESLLFAYFLIEIMSKQGIELIVDHCAICQSEKINYISVENGGFICHNCLENNNQSSYNLEVLKLFRTINKISLNDLYLIESSSKDYKTLLKIIYEFYTSYTGLKVKNFEKLLLL